MRIIPIQITSDFRVLNFGIEIRHLSNSLKMHFGSLAKGADKF
jgi:hypothetical protein